MSNLFGPPPPPPSRIFEPSATTAGQAGQGDDYWYEPESPREHRKLALYLAFAAVVFLLLANLGTWLHADGFHPSQATVVSTATFDSATRVIVGEISGPFSNERSGQDLSLPADSRFAAQDNQKFADSLEKASVTAVSTPAVRAAWDEAVAGALLEQQQRIEGEAGTETDADAQADAAIVLEIQTQDVADAITTALQAEGYRFATAGVNTAPFVVPVNGVSGSTASALGKIQSLWLVFWVLAIALAAGAIALASRPLRLAIILCIDAVVMLGAFLLVLQLAVQATDDRTTDGAQRALIRQGFDALIDSLESRTTTLILLAGGIGLVLSLVAWVRRRRRVAGAAT